MGSRRVVLTNIIWFSCIVLNNVSATRIQLTQGTVIGTINLIKGYKAYLGIPYATVLKRFQEAGPPPTWKGTQFAIHGSIKCYQSSSKFRIPIGRKECLVVNVFTPIYANDLLPVMVFIPGGGYYYNSNDALIYDPAYLVQKNVIVVTINYRLGAFGFLCLHKTGAPGNIGIKDQIAALHWIKNNIEAFGGDPNSLTVFGVSAGAASIHYILTTGIYKGLFNKAILESGSILIPYKIDRNPIETASYIASKMGYKSKDPSKLLQIFKNATANDIIRASQINPLNQPLKLYIYRPCVEYPVDKQSLITEYPNQLIKSKFDPDLKIIMGYNDKEGILYAGKYDHKGLENLKYTLSTILPENIKFTNESQKESLVNKIKKFYFKNGIDYDSLINYFSDSMIIYPSIESTKSFLSSNLSVYNYYFKYDSARNWKKFTSGLPQEPGADHGDEQYYLFDPVFYSWLPPKPRDFTFIQTLTTLWTNFARTGNPTSYTDIEWTQSNRDNLNFLQLDEKIKMIPLPNEDRFLFWDEVYKEYQSI